MKKTMLLIALGCALSAPAFAEEQKMTCDSGTIAGLTTKLDAMVDPALKEKVDAARGELAKAEEALKADKTDDCLEALKKTVDAMPGQPVE